MFLSDSFFDDEPFAWNKSKKNSIFAIFNKLNKYHYKNCDKYKNILDALNVSKNSEKARSFSSASEYF